MLTLKSMRTWALLLGCTTLLGACLPEDKDPSQQAALQSGGNNGKQTAGYYSAALGNFAMQIQNKVVSSADWFTETGGEHQSLANLEIAEGSTDVNIDYRVCPTGNDAEVLHITWLNDRDEDGNFSLKGVGKDTSALMTSLRTRVAAEQLGTYQGDHRLALANDSTTTIPAQMDCANLDIPVGAPVIAFTISRPATPETRLSRTEYRSVSCGESETGAAQTGTIVEKRTINYETNGDITVTNGNGSTSEYSPDAGWTAENMGQCLAAVNVAVTDSDANQSAKVALQNFANLTTSLKDSLAAQIASMKCRKDTVTSENTEADASREMNTCGDDVAITSQGLQVGDDAATEGDTMLLQCTSVVPNGTQASMFATLTGTHAVSQTWTGTAELQRDRTEITRNNQQRTRISRWIGRVNEAGTHVVNCTATNAFTVPCQNIVSAPPLVARSGARTINTTIAVDRSTSPYYSWSDPNDGGKDDMFVHNSNPGYLGLNAVQFRGWGWGRMFNCSSAWGFSFYYDDCMEAGIMYVNYFNGDYFKETANTLQTGVTVTKVDQAREWASRETFKPKITQQGSWEVTNVGCEWDKREPLADCPALMPLSNATGSWMPQKLSLTNPYPTAALSMYRSGSTYVARSYPISFGGDGQLPSPYGSGGGMLDATYWLVEHMNRQYNEITADGGFVKELHRPYHKYTNKACFFFGDCSSHIYGYLRMGPGEVEYLQRWENTPSAGVQTTLLNLDGVTRKQRAVESPANTVTVQPVTGLAAYGTTEPVHCGRSASVSETRWRYWSTQETYLAYSYYVQDGCFFFWCWGHTEYVYATRTVNHSSPVTITGSWVREWKSDRGWSQLVERYYASPAYHPAGGWTSYGAIPASF